MFPTLILVVLSCVYIDGMLISRYKEVTKSSQYTWSPGVGSGIGSYAVDGITNRTADNCLCCALTNHTYNPWYRLDLGKEFIISEFEILGRLKPGDSTHQNIGNVTITITDDKNATVFFEQTSTEVIYEYNNSMTPPIQARFIYLQKHGAKGHFTLCELSVFGDCVDGEFGYDCNSQCHCKNTAVPCDKTSGTCPTGGCVIGYDGPSCDRVCPHNKYGEDCNSDCGECAGDATCNHIDGTCNGCDLGYRNVYCSQPCEDGTFGKNCVESCGSCLNDPHCPVVDGICLHGCDPGKTGSTCKEECPEGQFGLQCTGRCYCKAGPCNKVTGECQGGCLPGYNGIACDEPCAGGYFGQNCSFGSGYYGQNCASVCGECAGGLPCNHIDGTYIGCEPGYLTEYCNVACAHGLYGQDCAKPCGNCHSNITCNIQDGTCINGCDQGYTGALCKQVCSNGTFGFNCNMTCGMCYNNEICNRMSGECPTGCEEGYTTEKCDAECDGGYFGQNCTKECGKCIGGITCNHVTGFCTTGCAPGYLNMSCNQECDPRYFGQNCSMNCSEHCVNGSVCNITNGGCDLGCENGHEEPMCKALLGSLPANDKQDGAAASPVGAIIGALVGIIVIAIAVFVVVFVIRRRRNLAKQEDNKSTFSANIYSNVEGPKNDEPSNDVYNYAVVMKPVNNGRIVVKEDTGTRTAAAIESCKDNGTKPTAKKQNMNVSAKSGEQAKVEHQAEPEYYGFAPRVTDLKIYQLWDYIHENKKDSCMTFYEEFGEIKSGFLHPRKVALGNKAKNRYKGICAYDFNRVPLTVDTEQESEYINASFINGYEKAKKFIASQGPIDEMVVEFWRMIWQYSCKQIVMLTNIIEMGKEKCIQYWPEKGSAVYGNITIKFRSVNTDTDYVIREFEIYKNEEGPKTVTQYHYMAWPDKDVPDSTWSLVRFWLMVTKDTEDNTDDVPVVVHCSAGVGRTGTYIAVDYLYNQGKREGTVRPLQAVNTLREQRPLMVQTKDQFVYLHEAVADTLLFGTHFIWSNQLDEVYTYLVESDPGTNTSRLRKQYQLIVDSIAQTDQRNIDEIDTVYSNITTRIPSIQVGEDRDTYEGRSLAIQLGAVFVTDYSGKQSLILAKSPSLDTGESFWKFIKRNHIKTVLMVTDYSSANYQVCQTLAMTDKHLQESLKVSVMEVKKFSACTQRMFKYPHQTKDNAKSTVCQFEYTKWNAGRDIPEDRRSMIDFVDHILEYQDRLSEKEPVLIHCSTGSYRCGIVSAIVTEFCRMKMDGGHINVVETVKLLKEADKAAIPTFEQYQYLYDVILSKVCGEVYENL